MWSSTLCKRAANAAALTGAEEDRTYQVEQGQGKCCDVARNVSNTILMAAAAELFFFLVLLFVYFDLNRICIWCKQRAIC